MYRRKAKNLHPDKLAPSATSKEREAAQSAFVELSLAYEWLKDPDKRKMYDTFGPQVLYEADMPQFKSFEEASEYFSRSFGNEFGFPSQFPDVEDSYGNWTIVIVMLSCFVVPVVYLKRLAGKHASKKSSHKPSHAVSTQNPRVMFSMDNLPSPKRLFTSANVTLRGTIV